ncbi:MAG: hypothetical protein ACK4NF_05700, partial [Planctomycetota bacterium]
DEKGPKDSFYVLLDQEYRGLMVNNYSCEIVEGIFKGYAIQIEGKHQNLRNSKVLTNGMLFNNFYIGRNYQRTRYVLLDAYQGGTKIIVINNKDVNEYNRIGMLTFSDDGKRVGFVAKKGNKEVAVIDGKESNEYDKITWKPIFSPNSKRAVFVAKKGNKEVMVIDGKESKKYDHIKFWPTFSPDGKRTGFIVIKDGEEVAVIDSNESNKYDWVSPVVFSPDSKRTAFVARKGNKEVAVIDGKESKGYDGIREKPIFSRDSTRVGFVAEIGVREKFLIRDEKDMRKKDMRKKDRIKKDRRKKRRNSRSRSEVAVIDGKKSNKYNLVFNIIFSPDSKKVGFRAKKDNREVVVIDGKESNQYDMIIGELNFSSDSKRVGFIAKKGSKYIGVVDGNESDEYDFIVDDKIKFIKGSKYAVFIGTKKVFEKGDVEFLSYLVVNNKETMSFKYPSTFAKVEKGFKFLASIGSKLYVVSCK